MYCFSINPLLWPSLFIPINKTVRISFFGLSKNIKDFPGTPIDLFIRKTTFIVFLPNFRLSKSMWVFICHLNAKNVFFSFLREKRHKKTRRPRLYKKVTFNKKKKPGLSQGQIKKSLFLSKKQQNHVVQNSIQ